MTRTNRMMNKTLVGALMAIVVVGGASFYVGMSYAKSQTSAAEQRGQFGNGQFGAGARTGRKGAGGATVGEVLSKDATSMTVKMPDGSTKIVIFGTSTQILKTSMGTQADLAPTTNVVVTGQSNSDGSVTAQNIQIRPAGMTGGFGGGRPQTQ